jgi:hypothetical protein
LSTERVGEKDVVVVRGPVSLRLLPALFVVLRDRGVCVARVEVSLDREDATYRVWMTDCFGVAVDASRWRTILEALIQRFAELDTGSCALPCREAS